MKKHLKILAAVLCIFICTATVFSAGLLSAADGHCCTEESCPVCALVSQHNQLFAAAVNLSFFGFFVLPGTLTLSEKNLFSSKGFRTLMPVNQKVKLTA